MRRIGGADGGEPAEVGPIATATSTAIIAVARDEIERHATPSTSDC